MAYYITTWIESGFYRGVFVFSIHHTKFPEVRYGYLCNSLETMYKSLRLKIALLKYIEQHDSKMIENIMTDDLCSVLPD